MPSSTFSYTSADGTPIAAYRWDPAGEPRAVVQLTRAGRAWLCQRIGIVNRK
jgi:hypothetical protein